MNVQESYVKRNQKFTDLFEGSFVKPEVLNQLTLLPKNVFNFKKITSSKKYTLIHHTDSLKTAVALVYEPNPVEYVVFHLKDSLIVESHEREITTEQKSVTGVITTSLYETIDAMAGFWAFTSNIPAGGSMPFHSTRAMELTFSMRKAKV